VETRNRDVAALTGALFVVLVIVAFIPLGGDTPDGDASAREVARFYSDNDSRELIAAAVLGLAAVPLLYFSALLRERLKEILPGRSALPTFAFAGGVAAAAGFLAAAGIHFTLADYSDDIQPAAAQALNALDADFFIPFTTGLAALLLGTSLVVVRTKRLLPTWLAWVGIVLFVVFFTPVGFVAFGLSGIWIIVVSVLLYRRGDSVEGPTPAAQP
jgi:hypothetical protein